MSNSSSSSSGSIRSSSNSLTASAVCDLATAACAPPYKTSHRSPVGDAQAHIGRILETSTTDASRVNVCTGFLAAAITSLLVPRTTLRPRRVCRPCRTSCEGTPACISILVLRPAAAITRHCTWLQRAAVGYAAAFLAARFESPRAAMTPTKGRTGQISTGFATSTQTGTVQNTRGALRRFIRAVRIGSFPRRQPSALTTLRSAGATVGESVGVGRKVLTAGQALTDVVFFLVGAAMQTASAGLAWYAAGFGLAELAVSIRLRFATTAVPF